MKEFPKTILVVQEHDDNDSWFVVYTDSTDLEERNGDKVATYKLEAINKIKVDVSLV